MPAAYAAKTALLHELQHPRLLCLTLDEVPRPEWVQADFFFHPLHHLDGLEVAQLLAPPGHSTLLVRGAVGAHHHRVRLPQRVRAHLLHGALLWWQASCGPDPQRLEAGQRVELAPGEEHGFVVLEDALLYNVITPSL